MKERTLRKELAQCKRYIWRLWVTDVAFNLKGSAETTMRGEMDGHGIWMWDEEKYRRIQENALRGIKSPTRTRFDSGVGGIIIDTSNVSCKKD